jgi:phosphate transport system substrate-binding protein
MFKSFLKASLLVFGLASMTLSAQQINGAGATFPNPIYSKWFSEYHNQNSNVSINYQSVGSGAGIQQLTAGTVDFGASDGPMTDAQLDAAQKARGTRVLHVPTVIGAVVPAYNIPGVKEEVKFSPDVLADIFLGKISNWSDARLAKDNPGIKLPNQTIVVVHRSDGSGTTYIFTDFLSKVSPDWAGGPGKSTAVKWPLGLGAKGNEGVAGMLRNTPGAIGYVELIYALQNNISYGSVKNPAGQFVKGSLQSTTAAAASVKNMPADFRVSITNAPGKEAYPICSFTWLLVPQHWKEANKQQAFVGFLNWMLDQGEKEVSQLNYAPLPESVASKVKAAVASIK